MRGRLLLIVVLAAGLAGAFAAIGRAEGGDDIGSAPELPIEQTIEGGKTAYPNNPDCVLCETAVRDFFRLTLRRSDRVTFDFGDTLSTGLGFCLLDPSVNDYNRANADCALQNGPIGGKYELKYVVPTPGQWTVELFNYCEPCNGSVSIGYVITAHVEHYTHTTILAPARIKHGSRISYTGSVSGSDGGTVELQSRSLRHQWKTFARVRLSASGTFVHKTKVARTGTYRIRAVYRGDATHLPSMTTVSFKVF